MSYWEALFLAIIEGLTEFLPVSSTGHMIIGSTLMGIQDAPFTKIFTVSIQFGAILSVLVLYHKQFLKSFTFYWKLAAAFLPAAVIGFLLDDYIDLLLGEIVVVAIMLILGGVFFLFVDALFKANEQAENSPDISSDWDQLPYPTAVKIGFYQCIAMIPGVSRSAATIIGGMANGLTRKSAAEFSFFLAVPTMFAATAYKLLKGYQDIPSDSIPVLVFGNVIAFVVALLAIRFFIRFVTRYGFKVFGYYRILVGAIILLLYSLGYDLSVL